MTIKIEFLLPRAAADFSEALSLSSKLRDTSASSSERTSARWLAVAEILAPTFLPLIKRMTLEPYDLIASRWAYKPGTSTLHIKI